MPAIVVAPDLSLVKVVRRGILTVPVEDAAARCACPSPSCSGLDVNTLPLTARALQKHVLLMGQRFIERMRVRGYELVGTLRLHGPWPSYDFNNTLADIESAGLNSDDPADALGVVHNRQAFNPYSDYLLVGEFLKQAVLLDIPVEVKV